MPLIHITGNTYINPDWVTRVEIKSNVEGEAKTTITKVFGLSNRVPLAELKTTVFESQKVSSPLIYLKDSYQHKEIRDAVHEQRDVVRWEDRKPAIYHLICHDADTSAALIRNLKERNAHGVYLAEIPAPYTPIKPETFDAYDCIAIDLSNASSLEAVQAAASQLLMLESYVLNRGIFLILFSQTQSTLEKIGQILLTTPKDIYLNPNHPKMAYISSDADGTRLSGIE